LWEAIGFGTETAPEGSNFEVVCEVAAFMKQIAGWQPTGPAEFGAFEFAERLVKGREFSNPARSTGLQADILIATTTAAYAWPSSRLTMDERRTMLSEVVRAFDASDQIVTHPYAQSADGAPLQMSTRASTALHERIGLALQSCMQQAVTAERQTELLDLTRFASRRSVEDPALMQKVRHERHGAASPSRLKRFGTKVGDLLLRHAERQVARRSGQRFT